MDHTYYVRASLNGISVSSSVGLHGRFHLHEAFLKTKESKDFRKDVDSGFKRSKAQGTRNIEVW